MSKAGRKRIIAEVEKTSPLKQNTSKTKKVKKTGKSKEPIRAIPELEDIDIFDYIKDKDTQMKGLIEGIEEKANEYPDKVMEDLLVLILKAFGYGEASINIDVGSNLKVDVNELLKHIYDINVKKNLNSFPLLVRKRELKRFKTNYTAFWSKLIPASEAIVFDTHVLENIIQALIGFSKSKLRTIRFGSAETLGTILTAVLDMLVKLNEEIKRQDSQVEKDQDEFKKKKEEVKTQAKQLNKITEVIMKEFLRKRFEDAMPEIRVKVLELLTLTAKKIPKLGYDENLLTTVRGLLNTDPEPQVVRACLDFIDQVAQPQEDGVNKTFQKSLRAMKKDLFELCFNSNATVAAKAFRFVKSHISMLEFKDDEIKQLCLLVFYEDEGMAAVAADFVDMMYFNGELLNDIITNEEFVFLKKQEESRTQLCEMTKLYEELNPKDAIDDKPEKFLKAFFRKTQILFDFQGILSLVIEEKANKKTRSKEGTLTTKQKKILLRLMLASIKVCKSFAETSLERALKPYAERILAHASDVVRYRAQDLLISTKLDGEILADLLPIFEETDLTLFFSEDNEENYETFMTTLSDVFEINQNPRAIESVVRVYNNLEKIPTVQREVLTTIKKLGRSLLKDFQDNFETYLNDLVIDKKGNQRVEKTIMDSLMKLHKISIHFIVEEMADNNFIDKISDALESFVNKFPVPADFALHAINILFYVHLWKLRVLLTKADVTEEDCISYVKMRDRLIEKLSVCFMVDDSIKRFSAADNQVAKNKLLKLQETSFTLLIETLCVISSDRFSKAAILFYQPDNTLLRALEDYVYDLEKSSVPVSESQLFNSNSKRLVEGLRKSRFLMQDDASEDEDEDDDKAEDDEDGDQKETKIVSKKPKAIEQKGPEQLDERLHFACSLITKLLMQSSRVLLSDFGSSLTIYFIDSPYQSIQALAKVLLGKIKTQELEEPEGPARMNYWRFVDGILLRLYQEGDLKKTCEIARMAAKLYFERYDRLEERKKYLVSEKFLKYMVNCILFAISDPKYYNFLSVLILLANKNYLDKENYKKLLAFFEVELKQRGKEKEKKKQTEGSDQKSESDIRLFKRKPDEDEIEEEGKDSEKTDDEMVDEAKEKEEAEYLNRFRQHMCKITGLKYVTPKETKRQSAANKVASAKKTRSSLGMKTRSAKKDQESEIEEENENEKEAEEEKDREEEDDQNDKENEDENTAEERQTRGKKKVIKKAQKKEEPKKTNTKKRKNRDYMDEGQKPAEEEEDVKDMVKGKQKTKKVKRTVK